MYAHRTDRRSHDQASVILQKGLGYFPTYTGHFEFK